MFDSIRIRLTIWYLMVLAFVMIAFAALAYVSILRVLARETDNNLVEMAENFTAEVRSPLRSGAPTSEAKLSEEVEDFNFRDYKFVVYDDAGRRIGSSITDNGDLQNALDRLAGQPSSTASFTDLNVGDDDLRLYRAPLILGSGRYQLFTVLSLEDQQQISYGVVSVFAVAVPLALLFSGLGGYFLARKSLLPMAQMSSRAASIGAANLHDRLPINNPNDELGRLATVLNALLDRLESSFEQQRRFMADASHELRTPLAIVRGESEVALSKETRSIEEYQESLRIVNDESKCLTEIVEGLFTLARADSGELKANVREVYLDELVGDCVRSIRTLAERRSIDIELTAAETVIRGDEALLRRMFLNLFDNAVKYNVDGGEIKINVANDTVSVSNTGEAIRAEHEKLIFERFYRIEKNRSHKHETLMSGAGLGLSIAKRIADLHDADLRYSRSETGENIFEVSFRR
jgi:two-component system, OmpR family, sensor kinase